MADRYAVLVESQDDLKVPVVAEALAAWKGVPVADAIIAARRCWGLSVESEEKPAADKLAGLLQSRGVGALAVPSSLLEELPAVEPIRSLASAPSKSTVLIAAAGFKKTTTREVKTTEGPSPTQRALKIGLAIAGVPTFGGGSREVVKRVEESDLVFYADVVLSDPPLRLRVDAQDFDYSCLGARKGYDALGNFRTLLMVVGDAAPAAVKNKGCRYLLDGKPVRETGYEGLADLEREERWLLTLRALGKAS